MTGVGVWTALNASVPLTIEDNTLVLGLPHAGNDLAGHLRLAQTRKLIETEVGRHFNQSLTLRVIEGTTLEDWATEKVRDAEKRKLNEQAMARARAATQAGTSWEGVYETLSRKFAETPNRSLPQNRARFYMEAVDIVATALRDTPITDDLAERNFARCIERVSQYAEVPSTLVAALVLQRSFEG